LTLISAAAGFGKTTLVGEWIDELRAAAASTIQNPQAKVVQQIAWLSLDEGDNDPTRFLTYLIAALQTRAPQLGTRTMAALQSPQPPPVETILTGLLNEISALPEQFVLVLDDYHVIEAPAVERALTFLLDHLPPQLHLVIATREDPQLPLARLRARGQLSEVRAADLRFTPAEAAEFLNEVMNLSLSADDIAALESRTEGWIAGLQLAALSMHGQHDTGSFIQSFTGSHRFVMDYLVEEVLHQQPADIQIFLLRTSILHRLCGPLCDALIRRLEIGDWRLAGADQAIDSPQAPIANRNSQAILEALEQANLFLIPLDNERRWYRYHHLFAELLRQRLPHSLAAAAEDKEQAVHELHIRASQWYEAHDLDLEAFHHATAAHDIERAERLIEGRGIPLHLRGAAMAILNWLASLPQAVLDARPALWWRYAALLLVNGQTTGVEEKLQAAESALQATVTDKVPDGATRNLIGRIATARATLALTRYQPEIMLTQSQRALEYLLPTNQLTRANANWTLGYAYYLQGDRAAARHAYRAAIAISQTSGDLFTTILATIGLGMVQEAENQLHQAAESYRRVLEWASDQPLQIIYEAHLGLARICCEWNDLEAAQQHGQASLPLARQYDRVIDRFIVCELFLARLKLAQGDVAGAAALVAQSDQTVQQRNFVHRIPEVAAAQVVILLRQGNLAAAAQLAQTHALPSSQARVHLAQGDGAAALRVIEPWRQQMEAKGWVDERLKALVLQALALQAHGAEEKAVQTLAQALALAEPGGLIRSFVDEGAPMRELLARLKDEDGRMKGYVDRLLAAFGKPEAPPPSTFRPQPLIEPLSERELEVLQLIAQGLSNHEIGARLFLALSTVKGHNQRIFGKLQVQRRTEAIARARELGLV
jgi:LuxR family maltose regulon positive regulatory protein